MTNRPRPTGTTPVLLSADVLGEHVLARARLSAPRSEPTPVAEVGQVVIDHAATMATLYRRAASELGESPRGPERDFLVLAMSDAAAYQDGQVKYLTELAAHARGVTQR